MHMGNVAAQLAAISKPQPQGREPSAWRAAQLSFSAAWPVCEPHARRRHRRAYRTVCPVQIALPLRVPKLVLTPLMGELEKILFRIAQAGGEMPNNPILGERAGGRGRSSVDRALRRLASIGRIRIETATGRRRVHIVGRDLATDWGEARPGHRPFCRNPGARTTGKATEVVVVEALPMLSGAHTLPVLSSLVGLDWVPPAVSMAAPVTCRWPAWIDGSKPDGRYCDAATHGIGAWCPEHQAMATRPSRKRMAIRCV